MVVRLYGHAYQLERKLHGGGEEREMARSRRERDNRHKSTSGEYYGHFFHFLSAKIVYMYFMETLYFAKLHHVRKREFASEQLGGFGFIF